MLRKVFLALAALFFIAAGTFHFLRPAMYMKIVPPYIPWPLAMVYISVAAEIAGGLGILLPPVQRSAALGLMALLVAVFPANTYMATNPVESGASALPPAALWGQAAAATSLYLVGAVVYKAGPPVDACTATRYSIV
jgi:uncharacterized membrane protein